MSSTPGEVAGLPDGGPATLDLVKAWLAITDDDDDTVLGDTVDAVNGLVRGMPVAQLATDADAWPARIVRGAVMLSARLWRRRNTPDGVSAFADLGAVYVQRNDPDVAMLLNLGAYAGPAVG